MERMKGRSCLMNEITDEIRMKGAGNTSPIRKIPITPNPQESDPPLFIR